MAKVTSKLQVTIPKLLAEQLRVKPGDEIEWRATDGSIRIVPAAAATAAMGIEDRLRLFDAASVRQRQREGGRDAEPDASKAANRGWSRDDLYDRGRAD